MAVGSIEASSESDVSLPKNEAAVVGAGLEVAAREPARDLQEERVLLPVLQRVAAHGGLCEVLPPRLRWRAGCGCGRDPGSASARASRECLSRSGCGRAPWPRSDGAAQRHRLRRSRHRDAVALVPPCELVADLVPAQRAEVQVYVRGV